MTTKAIKTKASDGNRPVENHLIHDSPFCPEAAIYFAFFMHLPIALHLAGLGQPAHGLNVIPPLA